MKDNNRLEYSKDSTRLKLSAKEFISYWKKNKKPDAEMAKYVKYEKERVTFENVVIDSLVKIENIKKNAKLRDVVIKNCRTKNFSIVNSRIRNFRIENSQTGNFLISNCQTGSLQIEQSFTGSFWIETCEVEQIHFEKSSANKILIEDSQIGNFKLEESQVADTLVDKAKMIDFHINASTIGVVMIHNYSKISLIYIWVATKIAQFIIIDGYIDRVIAAAYNGLIGHFKCHFLPNQSTDFLFRHCLIGHLDFADTILPQNTTISTSNCSVNSLTFNNTINFGNLIFSNLKTIENWEDFDKDEGDIYKVGINQVLFLNASFWKKSEEGKYIFNDRHRVSCFSIINSDLGNIQLLNTNLSAFKEFKFFNSKILNAYIAGTILPQKITKLDHIPQKHYIHYHQERLAFGQFKKIYNNQGDYITSLNYTTLEMEAYRSELRKCGLLKVRGELFMLWMNKVSTNYGTSWQRGVASTLIALGFFYSVFIILTDKYTWDFSWNGVKEFGKIMSYAPYFLNPLRDKDSIFLIEENDFTPLARVWDFISRIFLTYFVYQTIQAFRKLSQSSY